MIAKMKENVTFSTANVTIQELYKTFETWRTAKIWETL